MIGDIYLNTKTGKESIVIKTWDNQIQFALIDNPNRKFQLTEVQMTNMIKIGPPEYSPIKRLPTVPECLNGH